ncbi:FYDLN acid domain-containing protein [Sphingomonas sp. LY29]|uniref:FYDLN acid domain-containing protein n=1 Tax=unclassified Sphingomonas TaxID=196159 RepID=UPI002ADECD27|nr:MULTISPECIES: FYDLN acid domain-containing protein [unclassified Sphingomonas]MEA1073073.1 FYDLN acid domain-containing protein [Sphingomonas sp. LY160]WRP26503.1 FYDLN acid domain-containing protein [Sphingomonas sp. LY29]
MVKPEWGAKRTCPKCSTRFYDLGNDEPVTCIACDNTWVPEPVLKSKQPLPYEVAATPDKVKEADEDLGAEDLVPDEDEEPSADDEVDLATGEDDLGVATKDEDDDN